MHPQLVLSRSRAAAPPHWTGCVVARRCRAGQRSHSRPRRWSYVRAQPVHEPHVDLSPKSSVRVYSPHGFPWLFALDPMCARPCLIWPRAARPSRAHVHRAPAGSRDGVQALLEPAAEGCARLVTGTGTTRVVEQARTCAGCCLRLRARPPCSRTRSCNAHWRCLCTQPLRCPPQCSGERSRRRMVVARQQQGVRARAAAARRACSQCRGRRHGNGRRWWQ